jgi:membrane-associated phospholipid phosphatase
MDPGDGKRRSSSRTAQPGRAAAATSDDLSSRRVLRFAALAVGLPLAAFAPHAVQAWRKEVSAWDAWLSERIHALENRDTILGAYVDPFDVVLHPAVQLLGAIVVLVAIAATFRDGRQRLAITSLLAVGGAVVLGPVLKEVFERPPVDPSGEHGGSAFPSGHALRSMAAASVLGLIAWPKRWRWPVVFGAAFLVLLIGVAVVYHEWHWASDVLGGWSLALAWLGCVWLTLRPPLGTPHREPTDSVEL